MYINKGYIQGLLAREPQKVAEGVVLLTIRVRDSRINPATERRDFHYPSFVIFGKEADKAVQYLVKGQEASVEYKLETRKKEIKGEIRYFEDKVVTNIVYGRKPEETADVVKVSKVSKVSEVEEVKVKPEVEDKKEDNEMPKEDN